MILFLGGLAIIAAYLAFVAVRVGVHQRSVLALGSISLDTIPDRAAKMHGDKPLFTCDTPVSWDVPPLTGRYPDPTRWNACRIASTAAFLAAMLIKVVGVRRGDRVAIFKENHFDTHLLHLSVVRAGGIACTINGNSVRTTSSRTSRTSVRRYSYRSCNTLSRVACRRDVRRRADYRGCRKRSELCRPSCSTC